MTFDPSALQEAQTRNRPSMPTVLTPQKPVPAAYQSPGMGIPATAAPSPRPGPPRQQRAVARWVVGPLIAAVVGFATLLTAGFIQGAHPTPVTRGKLNISSEPEGATVLIEGKVHPHATPMVIEGEIGATLHVGFRLDGYLDRDAEVFVGEGERPFRVKLDRRDAPTATPTPTKDPDNEDMLAPTPIPTKRDNDRPVRKKEPVSKREKPPNNNDTIAPVMGGTGTLSVHVRPWAIVYIDGAKIRQTPVSGHSLTAGLHSVELVNDGLHKREKVTVEVRASSNEEIHRNWE